MRTACDCVTWCGWRKICKPRGWADAPFLHPVNRLSHIDYGGEPIEHDVNNANKALSL